MDLYLSDTLQRLAGSSTSDTRSGEIARNDEVAAGAAIPDDHYLSVALQYQPRRHLAGHGDRAPLAECGVEAAIRVVPHERGAQLGLAAPVSDRHNPSIGLDRNRCRGADVVRSGDRSAA